MNDTLIFFVLAALALVFKWLTSMAEKNKAEKETHEAESAPPNDQAHAAPLRPAPESEEERVRRFLEALGMPAGTQPPPPVRQRRVVTPTLPPTPPAQKPKVKRSWAQPLPPLVTTPDELPSAPPPLPAVTSVAPPPELEEPLTPLPAFVPAIRRAAQSPPVPVASLGAMLRSPASVRRAIVLREVLGPPRGLQPVDA